MYHPIQIANYFVAKSLASGNGLTPIKVLKLCYLAHGWHLGITNGEPLISEAVEAWKYGPVIPSIYQAFKSYKKDPITSICIRPDINSDPIFIDSNTKALLDKVWDTYKNYTGLQLSTITHEEGSPWYQKWEDENGKNQHSVIIENDRIKDYYSKKLAA